MTTATTGTPSADTTARTRYMWLITVQWPTGHGGFGNATLSSTVDVPPGMSRLDLYMQIFEIAKQRTGANSLNVIFFSLEPDQLNG